MKKVDESQQVVEEEKEVVQEQTASPKTNVIKLEKKSEEKPLDAKVEESRLGLLKSYKRTSTINNILLVVVAGIFIGSFFLITRGDWMQILGWCLIGATIAGLVTYFLLTRKRYPDLSRQYFKVFWEETNNFLFDDDKFTSCEINIDERYEMADVISQKVYKDIVSVASRNIVRGKYEGKDFAFGELGLYRPGQRRNSRDVVFVGRHLELNNNLSIENRYIVNIKRSENEVDLPTDIEDLVVLHNEGLLTIYGIEGSDFKKDLGELLIADLNSIVCADPLLNVNIVFWNKKTFCYLSYDDSIVAIPFEKPLDLNSYQALKNNINQIFEILSR